jgi:hypothetical protein
MFRSLALAAVLLGAAVAHTPVFAQATSANRVQVQMDRDAFLSMVRWDEMTGNWVLKDGMAMPAGIKSRAEVMAMTEEFLKMHRWDETQSTWIPNVKPRDMSTLTREQVRMETVRFLMTHRYDEHNDQWVSKFSKP